jgi:hypothetical protein
MCFSCDVLAQLRNKSLSLLEDLPLASSIEAMSVAKSRKHDECFIFEKSELNTE